MVAPANGSCPTIVTWLATISPYSTGKTSSDRSNSVRDRISGTARPARRQRCTDGRTCGQVREGHFVHERQRVQQLIRTDQTVCDQRLEARSERLLEVGGQRRTGRPLIRAHRRRHRSVHALIMRDRGTPASYADSSGNRPARGYCPAGRAITSIDIHGLRRWNGRSCSCAS